MSDSPVAGSPGGGSLEVFVCVKWLDLRPEIDPVSGAVSTDHRRYGFSEADRAALEVGVRLAECAAGSVTIVSAAPAGADGALRELAACGAGRVVRLDLDEGGASRDVATGIATVVAAAGSIDPLAGSPRQAIVVCGDHSLDRGSGSVPGLVAHRLGWAQALGVLEVAEVAEGGVRVVRRLDGGRREHLEVPVPAVVSVEGSVETLRRASLSAVLAARTLEIEVTARVDSPLVDPAVISSEPIRPRARVFPAPTGDTALSRIVELTGALVERTPPRRVVAEPAEAAAAIVEQLGSWGYLHRASE
jgi:electron transfer flavoprotein beta subunit